MSGGEAHSAPLHTELRRLRDALGWSARDLANRLGCHLNLVGQWERGASGGVPPSVLAWLGDVVGAMDARPPPAGWRRASGRRAARLAREAVPVRVNGHGGQFAEVPAAVALRDPAPPALPVGAMGYVRVRLDRPERLALYERNGALGVTYAEGEGFEVVRERLGQQGYYLSRDGSVYPPVG